MVAVTEQRKFGTKFDAIVIGSGMGGLTVAALLSKLNRKRVLVLEQHFIPGGFTHSFERKGKFHWDVGLHYVGEMDKGELGKAVFDYLTNGDLKWHKMPDPFEKFVYPDFTFELYSDPKRFQADLIQRFPHQHRAIEQYFKDVKRATFWFEMHSLLELFPAGLQPFVNRFIQSLGALTRQTTQNYLDQHFQDAHLKALLVSQWGSYGLSPSQSSFGIHSTIVSHYLKGGWYPVGGAKEIAKSIIPIIERSGGTILTQRRVTEILLDNGKAVGVRVQHAAKPQADPEIYSAPIIVSDAGALNTYLKLIPPSYPLAERQEMEAFARGSTTVTVYLGLKESPQKLGFRGENHWIYTTYDHNEIDQDLIDPNAPSQYLPKACYLSFPSLKDPLAQAHTAEIIAGSDYDSFLQWQEKSWRRRGRDYNELKAQITNSLIHLVESHYPGFRDLIEYAELSTPLTLEYFDASHQGAIYGVPSVPERMDQSWLRARTPIKNLYLTGADTFSLGIMGAMMGGVKTAGLLNGAFGFFRVMATIMLKSAWRSR